MSFCDDPVYIRDFMLKQRGKLFIDVGGYEGYYSINLSRNFEKVIVYEPYSPKAEYIRRLIKELKLNNVEVRQIAVSDKNGKMELNISDLCYTRNSLENIKESKLKIDVESRTLNDEFPEEKIDLIKIDVEGHEFNVLEGMNKIISNVKSIFIEVHDREVICGRRDTAFENTKKRIELILQHYGFKTQWIGYNYIYGDKNNNIVEIFKQ